MIRKILIDLLTKIENNRGKFLGAFLGFLIGVMILTIGFFKSLFIIICTIIGYTLGGRSYTKASIKEFIYKVKDWLERNLPPGGIV